MKRFWALFDFVLLVLVGFALTDLALVAYVQWWRK